MQCITNALVVHEINPPLYMDISQNGSLHVRQHVQGLVTGKNL